MVLISPVTEMAVGDIAASDAIFAASKGSLGDVSFLSIRSLQGCRFVERTLLHPVEDERILKFLCILVQI